MCEYCEHKEFLSEDSGVDVLIANYTDNKKQSFIEFRGVYIHISFEINFCPICGRKLSDD